MVQNSQRALWAFGLLVSGVGSSLLSGCRLSSSSPTSDSSLAASRIRGSVHGGQQPVSGATIQAYAVGTNGDGSAAMPLLGFEVTNSKGQFDLGSFDCPSASSLVYIIATGGNPGNADSEPNPMISEMAALGPCGNITDSTFVSVNELTTVASVFPLAPFMDSITAIGAGSQDADALTDAFRQVNMLVNPSSGLAPGLGLSAGTYAPLAEMNTLADILATCINSEGGVAGDGSSCGALFNLAHLPGQPAPTETVGAVLQIAKNPLLNVATIWNLTPSSGPYQTTLTAAPFDWTVSVRQSSPVGMPQRSNLIGEYLLNAGEGSVATDTSGLGNDGMIFGATWEGDADLNFTYGNYIALPVALNTATTWQFAFFAPPFGNATYPQPPGYGDTTQFPINSSLLCGTDTAHTCFAGPQSISTALPDFLAYNTSGTQPSAPLNAGWHVVTLVGGQNGQLDHYYFDGSEVTYLHQGTGLFPHPATGNYQIGGSSQYTGTFFVGKIAGSWAWGTSLSASEAQQAAQSALSYIRSKGAMPSYSPNVHTLPLVVGGVDSRTAGFQLQNVRPWIGNLSLSDPTYTALNLGINGTTLYDHLKMYDLLEAPQIAANTAATIEVFWGGVNDFSFGGHTPSDVADSLKGLVSKAKALGARVIVATEISSNAVANGDLYKNELNAIVRAQAFLWGADNLADLATISQLGADGAYASTYFVDGLHPSDSGEPYITSVMSNAVNELLGSTAASHHSTSAESYTELAGDDYLDLSGSAPQTVTLPSCVGFSRPRQIVNLGNVEATIIAQDGENLSGGGAVGIKSTGTFSPVPGPLSTGGCSWQRIN